MKQEASVKPYLIEKLKQEHCLWSYDNDSIHDMPDDMLIELVMLYLDIDEINMLFSIFSYKKMKKAWIENVVAQGERYYNLNYFFAWYNTAGAYVGRSERFSLSAARDVAAVCPE